MLFDETEVPAGDCAMAAFTPVYEEMKNDEIGAMEKEVVCCTVAIKNQVQFDYVLSLIAAGLSFNKISTAVKKNHDCFGTAVKSGCASLGEASVKFVHLVMHRWDHIRLHINDPRLWN